MEIYTQEFSGGECSQKQSLWGRGRKQHWVQREVELLCALTGGLADLTRSSGVEIVLHLPPTPTEARGPVLYSPELIVIGYEMLPGKGHDLGRGSCFQQQAILWGDLDEHCELTGSRQLRSWRETGRAHRSIPCILPKVHLFPGCDPYFMPGKLGPRASNEIKFPEQISDLHVSFHLACKIILLGISC